MQGIVLDYWIFLGLMQQVDDAISKEEEKKKKEALKKELKKINDDMRYFFPTILFLPPVVFESVAFCSLSKYSADNSEHNTTT